MNEEEASDQHLSGGIWAQNEELIEEVRLGSEGAGVAKTEQHRGDELGLGAEGVVFDGVDTVLVAAEDALGTALESAGGSPSIPK